MNGFYHTVFLNLVSRNLSFFSTFIFLFFFTSSCNERNSQDAILKKLITENNRSIVPNFNGYLLLIPNDGCHPCIQKALRLAKKNINNKHIYFIITSDFDFKSTKLKFSKIEMLSNNLIFDLQKKSNFLGLHKSYLTIFYYQNGEKVFEKAINPEEANNELFELQIRLNEIKE